MKIKKIIRVVFLFFSELLIQTLSWLSNILPISHKSYTCRLKNKILKICGIKIDDPVFIDKGFRFICPKNIKIDRCVSLGHDNHIWAFTPVTIGHNTITAKDLLIISASHDTTTLEPKNDQSVKIGPGCWIGARVTILGHVTIGKGCIIGAGSLVRRSIPDWSIAAGVPARVIRKRTPSRRIWNHFGWYPIEDLYSN